MNPALLQKVAMGLMNGMPGGQGGNPAFGLGQAAGGFLRKRFGPQSQGAELPQTPYHFDPQGPPNIAPQAMPGVQRYDGPMMNTESDPGFQPARPRFPGDPGIDPGMTPPRDPSIFGPVPLGGRRTNRWGF